MIIVDRDAREYESDLSTTNRPSCEIEVPILQLKQPRYGSRQDALLSLKLKSMWTGAVILERYQ